MVWNKLAGRSASARQKAYIEAMVILAMADGEVRDEEIHDMSLSCSLHPALSPLGRAVNTVMHEISQSLTPQIFGERIYSIAEILKTPEQRMDAIGLAVSVSASDGIIQPEELQVLKYMQTVFELSDEQIEQVIEKYQ